MQTVLGFAIVALAVWGIVRQIEVRLVLMGAALALGLLAGSPAEPIKTFFRELVNPAFVVPICASLGFAQVVKATGCDKHLVWLLLRPLERVKPLLLPGVVVAAFVVNIPIVSQTGTVATVGPIALPLLLAAGVKPVVAAAGLFLGASVGGELLNTGGPEYGTVISVAEKISGTTHTRIECVHRNLLTVLTQLFVATGVFWWMNRRHESFDAETATAPTTGRANLAMAAVPLVPLAILFLTSEPFAVWKIPPEWLASPKEIESLRSVADYRTIGFAMLVGVLVCAAVTAICGDRKSVGDVGREFFKGAGYAYAEVISLIVVARCFVVGVEQAGVAQGFDWLAAHSGPLFGPMAVFGTAAFAMLCGSGIAATTGLFPFFAASGAAHGHDPFLLGCIVVVGSAAGRTASPVAAAGILAASLVNTEPWRLARSVFLPLLAGLAAAFAVHSIR